MIYALCIFVSHYPKVPTFVQKLVKIGLVQFGSKSQFLARKFKDFLGFLQGFRYMSCVYWPLLTAVFSCLQIVPPMNKMKGAKNEKSGKSGKMLQFY